MKRWLVGAVFAGLLGVSTVGVAQEEDPGESRAETFEAATGAQTENIPGGALMVISYGVIWLLLMAYVGSIGFRQTALKRELEQLRQDLKTDE